MPLAHMHQMPGIGTPLMRLAVTAVSMSGIRECRLFRIEQRRVVKCHVRPHNRTLRPDNRVCRRRKRQFELPARGFLSNTDAAPPNGSTYTR